MSGQVSQSIEAGHVPLGPAHSRTGHRLVRLQKFLCPHPHFTLASATTSCECASILYHFGETDLSS